MKIKIIPPHTAGVYQIKNNINNKSYIGSTQCLHKRCYEHYRSLKNGKHVNKYLQNSYNKHLDFEFVILEEVEKLEHLTEREEFYIQRYKTNQNGFGFNLRKVSESNRGLTMSAETRAKLSKFHKGKKKPPKTQEYRDKVSKFFKGRLLTAEHKEKISKNHSKHNLGKKLTPEHVEKLRLSHLGHVPSETALEKMSISMRGRNSKLSEDDIIRIKKHIRDGLSLKKISEMFNVSANNISDIKREKIWQYVKIN